MAHSSTPKQGNTSTGYFVPTEDVCSQAVDKHLVSPERTQDAGTKMFQGEFDFNKLQETKQNRKRIFSVNNLLPHNRDADKKSRTEICSGSVQVSPSHIQENIPSSNVCQDKEIKEYSHTLCMASLDEVTKHAKENEQNLPSEPCQCKYINNENEQLRLFCFEHANDPFFCNICKFRYSEKNWHGSKHLCNFCEEEREFQCITLLEDHYSSHEIAFKIKCIVCEREFKEHSIKVEGRLVFKCCQTDYCSYESVRKWSLQTHLYTHSKFKIFKCKYCWKRFSNKKNLEDHLSLHPRCAVCQEIFFDQDSLTTHFSEKHPWSLL